MKGRKPLPTATKEASGAYVINPQRKNHSEPKPVRGQPIMPDFIDCDSIARKCWISTCATLDGMGVLTIADASVLALYCSTYSQWAWLSEQVSEGSCSVISSRGSESQSPEAHQVHKYADRLVRLMVELGLTPSARSRLHVAEKEEVDPFEQWLEARGSG